MGLLLLDGFHKAHSDLHVDASANLNSEPFLTFNDSRSQNLTRL